MLLFFAILILYAIFYANVHRALTILKFEAHLISRHEHLDIKSSRLEENVHKIVYIMYESLTMESTTTKVTERHWSYQSGSLLPIVTNMT